LEKIIVSIYLLKPMPTIVKKKCNWNEKNCNLQNFINHKLMKHYFKIIELINN
jgi:hypothetical protein